MIQASDFIKPAVKRGFRFWSGVPCSFLKPFINYVIESPELEYVAASSEGEAVAISLGAHLSGQKTVTICQNSGLGNTVNPLTSLNFPFKIPTLLIVTHRGAPGITDEPQHELMGQITEQLLSDMRIPWKVFPDSADQIESVLDEAENVMSKGQPFALIMKKGTVDKYPLKKEIIYSSPLKTTPIGKFHIPPSNRLNRADVLKCIVKNSSDNDLIIATTGKTGRELYTLGHRPNQLYVVGGMGCASGIGLGLALNSKKKVIVLDGDGAALMKLGTLATVGHYQPSNLLHILIDNQAHESTGGQFTTSGSIDFGQIASACGYRQIERCETEGEIQSALMKVNVKKGPTLIHIKIKVGSDPNLGRPKHTPEQVKNQFMEFCARTHESTNLQPR